MKRTMWIPAAVLLVVWLCLRSGTTAADENAGTVRERATLKGHQGMVYSVAVSPDGKTLASSGSADAGLRFNYEPGEIKLWDAATGKVRATLKGHAGPVHSVMFSPDGKTLASADGG